jgi:single-stranded-DNA-specific exonuclease
MAPPHTPPKDATLRWTPRGEELSSSDTNVFPVDAWAERLSVSPFLIRLLWRRGLRNEGDMDVFLSPGLKHLASPSAWPGMSETAELLAKGLTEGLPFAVWGDYDVDGVTSTALVKDTLTQRGYKVEHHIPNRLEEGYGLSVEGVDRLADAGIRLLLTVDCGISDHAAVARARERGMLVLVSDHHTPSPELPPAQAICNPKLGACPCPDLAGVGVAFFLMAAVNRLLPGTPIDMRQMLDLVALGTLADVVPLTGQNRILVKNGMLLLNEAKRPGVAALKDAAGFAVGAALGAGQLVFGLAPRINAAGRMGQGETALRLLLAPDFDAARPLAAILDELNAERRREEERILGEALDQAETQLHRLGLVLCDPGWHPGVIGIVASRIVENFYRPTLILCEDRDRLKGSGRSIPEFDLYSGVASCQDLLLGFGGHHQAAGLSLAPENLDQLRERFHQVAAEQLGPAPLTPRLKIDEDLPFHLINFDLLKELDLLQPFGQGNPEPLFSSPDVVTRNRRVFGANHAAVELQDPSSGVTLRAKAWRMADKFGPEFVGKKIRVAFTPKIDRYNGCASIDLRLKDWKYC